MNINNIPKINEINNTIQIIMNTEEAQKYKLIYKKNKNLINFSITTKFISGYDINLQIYPEGYTFNYKLNKESQEHILKKSIVFESNIISGSLSTEYTNKKDYLNVENISFEKIIEKKYYQNLMKKLFKIYLFLI